MSCIRFNTSAQRKAMRDNRPIMLPAGMPEEAPIPQSAPPVTAATIRRVRLLASDTNPKIRETAASGYHTPDDVFLTLSSDPDEGVRSCVARNEATPCDVLRLLAADTSERVRGFLALNYHVPNDVMTVLSDDSSDTVRGLVDWKRRLSVSASLAHD